MSKSFRPFVPFIGAIDLNDGRWHPNYELKMLPAQQQDLMVDHGYICKCGFTPHKCQCHK